MVPVETHATFSYALVTKFGRVGVYDGSLQLLDSYVIALSEGGIRERIGDTNAVDRRRRLTSIWLTDAIHVPDANVLLLASSDRSLHIYDSSILIHAPLFVLKGMRHVPLCLAYAVAAGENPSMLIIGDSASDVTTLKFQQPRSSLLRRKNPEQVDKYYWMVRRTVFKLHSAPFQATAAVSTRFSFFWDVMWRRLTLCHRRFGTTYRYHIQESSSQRRVSSLPA